MSFFRYTRCTALFLFFIPVLVCGQEEEFDLVTDRPDQTESALTVPTARVQIEAGIELLKEEGERSMSLPTVLARVGVHSRLELRAGGAYIRNTNVLDSTVDGLGGVTLGAKVQLFGSHLQNPRGALIAEISPSVGSDGVSPEGLEGAMVFCLSHEFGSLALGTNLGIEFADGAVPSGLYSLTYSSGIAGNVGGFLEVFGSISSDGAPQHSFNVGTTLLLWPNVQLDLANAFPLSDAAPNTFFTAGVSWRLPR